MLRIDLTIADGKSSTRVGELKVVRGEQHPRHQRAYWYSYQAEVIYQSGKTFHYTGTVLHSYDNGAVRLAQKILKAVSKQDRESNDLE